MRSEEWVLIHLVQFPLCFLEDLDRWIMGRKILLASSYESLPWKLVLSVVTFIFVSELIYNKCSVILFSRSAWSNHTVRLQLFVRCFLPLLLRYFELERIIVENEPRTVAQSCKLKVRKKCRSLLSSPQCTVHLCTYSKKKKKRKKKIVHGNLGNLNNLCL